MERSHDSLCPPFNGHLPLDRCEICRLIAKVRADEREKWTTGADLSFLDAVQARKELKEAQQMLADLRAKVEALPAYGAVYTQAVSRANVLALIEKMVE
jgi:hypothetical protein